MEPWFPSPNFTAFLSLFLLAVFGPCRTDFSVYRPSTDHQRKGSVPPPARLHPYAAPSLPQPPLEYQPCLLPLQRHTAALLEHPPAILQP